MSFRCLQFSPKYERKQVDLRFHSSKVEFVRSFFWRKRWLEKVILTLSDLYIFRRFHDSIVCKLIIRQQLDTVDHPATEG